MSTPAYVAPYVGPAGLVIPSYAAILADNVQGFLNIYGQNQYVAQNSAIYQLLSLISLKQADTMQAVQLSYNQTSPQTAVGAGLDRVVKMNGLARAPHSFSTAFLTLTGSIGTTIINGAAQDQNGNQWELLSPLTFTSTTLTALAVCTTPGAISASPNVITIIATPTLGWTSVTNNAAAVTGAPVEQDSQLRARQAISVALPSVSPLAGTLAAVLAVSGVARVAPGYPTPGGPGSSIENPTSAVDSWGNPPHSISIVAEGGSTLAVATAIYAKKTLGCATNGSTAVEVTDPNTGIVETISYYQPTYIPVFVLMTLTGYGATPTSSTLAAVQSAIVAYLNTLNIGETVSLSALIYEAMALNASLSVPSFGVQSALIGTLTTSTTAATTVNSTVITLTSAADVVAGQLVVGSGIPVGATVVSLSGTACTLSVGATLTAVGVSVQFSTITAADFAMPTYYSVAQGAAANVSVLS